MHPWKAEPVLVTSAARLVAMLAAGYGLELTAEQLITVWSVVEILGAFVMRSRVSPV